MANTFIPIAKTVLTGTQATITFSNIPQTYSNLKILAYARGNASGESNVMQFSLNGLYPTVTYARMLYNGSTAVGARGSGQFACFICGLNSVSNNFGVAEINIPRYTNTSYNKVYAINSYQPNTTSTANTINYCFGAHVFQNTAAISSIDLTVSGGSFIAGSRFDLYGIAST